MWQPGSYPIGLEYQGLSPWECLSGHDGDLLLGTWEQPSEPPTESPSLLPSYRGMSFHGTTIGLAPLMAMCSVYQSGGVNMVSLSRYTDAAEGRKLPHKIGGHLVKKKKKEMLYLLLQKKENH